MTRGPQKQFDRGEVLDRAMELFWSKGYEATGMTDLVTHMGIGRQSLYDTFGDKRSLFAEAIRQYFNNRVAPVVTILRAPGSPVGNLKKVFAYWESLAGHERSGCMIGNTVAELADDEIVAPLLRDYLEGMENEFCELMKRARAAGEIDTKVSDRDLARMLVPVGQGMALLSRVRTEKASRAMLKGVQRTMLAAMGAD